MREEGGRGVEGGGREEGGSVSRVGGGEEGDEFEKEEEEAEAKYEGGAELVSLITSLPLSLPLSLASASFAETSLRPSFKAEDAFAEERPFDFEVEKEEEREEDGTLSLPSDPPRVMEEGAREVEGEGEGEGERERGGVRMSVISSEISDGK